MRKINLKKIWFIIYMFLAVFEPPLLPVSFIYVLGVFTVFLFLLKYRMVIPLGIVKGSRIYNLFKVFMIMLVYLLSVSLINFYISDVDLILNRIKCVNQLVVLSFIEFLAVWYIFILADDLQYGLNDIIRTIIIVGIMQGICAGLAYMSPTIRSMFVRFGDRNLFTNAYFVERRGYGFSMTLIDTFGYGMGLIAGYLLLMDWKERKLKNIIALTLMLFAIFVNARTGIIIFGIAVILKIFQGENLTKQVIKVVAAIPILYILVMWGIPKVLEWGIKSTNITVSWVMTDLYELYTILLYGDSIGTSLTDASFLSNFGNLPSNIFEFIFGSGHSIYDTTQQLGFRTDIGYINLLWEFGVIGTIILLGGIFVWMIRPLKWLHNSQYRMIIWLNLFSYFLVLFKAILIGYNPGIVVNYMTIFAIYYYTDNKTSLEERVLNE